MNTATSLSIHDNSSLSDIYVVRQPILDRKKKLYAYELLFRDSLKNMVLDVDGDRATSKVLLNSYLNIGLDTLSGGKTVFINFTRNLIVQELPSLFPRDTKYLQLIEFYEVGEWKAVGKLAAELCIIEEKLPPIYLKACQFASLLPA